MAEPKLPPDQFEVSQPCMDPNPVPPLIPNPALTLHENDRVAKMTGVTTEPPTPPATYLDYGPPGVVMELVHDNPEAANGAKFKDITPASAIAALAATGGGPPVPPP